MFLGDPPGPRASEDVFQGLGFSDALKRVAQNSFNQFENAKRRMALGLSPVSNVFAKLSVKNGFARNGPSQYPSPGATWKPAQA